MDLQSLIIQNRDKAKRVAARYTDSPDDAEDVVQDASIRAFEYIGTLKNERAFPAWYFQIVARIALDRRRSRWSKSLPLLNINFNQNGFVFIDCSDMGYDVVRREIEAGLAHMSEPYQQLLRRHLYDGLTIAEAALECGVHPVTARGIVAEAKAHLRLRLSRSGIRN